MQARSGGQPRAMRSESAAPYEPSIRQARHGNEAATRRGPAFEGTCALSNWQPNSETECRDPKSEVGGPNPSRRSSPGPVDSRVEGAFTLPEH
jgi:hypothetical protein